jgi:phosphoglucosamine mutase
MSDFTTTGDGLVAALQLMAVVRARQRPVSEVCHRFEPTPQILKNVRFGSSQPLEQPSVKQAISEGEARLGASGRLVIRQSGTEPVIRVMAQGDDQELVQRVVADVCDAVRGLVAMAAE